jgi:iron complex transport system substrate-binding protein
MPNYNPILSSNFYCFFILACLLFVACERPQQVIPQTTIPSGYKQITDMRRVSVTIPQTPERVITVSDGMIETVMAHFGVIDRLVGLGSSCLQRNFSYEIPGMEQPLNYVEGMNPVRLLYPDIASMPLIAGSGLPLQLEKIAALNPDLILLREGCCTIPNLGDPKSQQALSMLSSFGIPMVVFKGTNQFDPPDLGMFNQEIALLGEIFNQEEKARGLISFLENSIGMVTDRTSEYKEDERPKVLLLGLSPIAREGGSAGVTKGKDTMEGFIIEKLVNARNAYQGIGGRTSSLLLNMEQVFALDPDVIVLPTSSGYHPPEELYEAPYYSKLQSLRAVKSKKVMALPWTPCNCSKRIEYPIEVMMTAKVSYPAAFEDIEIHEWVLSFYQKIYNVDRDTAKAIRSAQWLDWTVDHL